MRRRDLFKAAVAVGLLGRYRPAQSAEHHAGERVTPVTGPDHPFAPKRILVYGLGVTGACILSKSVDEFIGDYWMMWARVPNDALEHELSRWGTDLYPFSERNVSRLNLLARLGDCGADLLPALVAAWQHRVPVELLLLDSEDGAGDEILHRAHRQAEALSHVPDVVRLGRSEADAQHFLDMRAGCIPPEECDVS